MLNNQIEKILKDNNLSITQNRIKIISCLQDGLTFHTIKNIAEHAKLNVKSIYNNIKVLEQSGVVDSFSFNGISKFALCNRFYNKQNYVIHIVNDKEINHLSVKENIFKEITKNVEENGYKSRSVRVFVEVEKKN